MRGLVSKRLRKENETMNKTLLPWIAKGKGVSMNLKEAIITACKLSIDSQRKATGKAEKYRVQMRERMESHATMRAHSIERNGESFYCLKYQKPILIAKLRYQYAQRKSALCYAALGGVVEFSQDENGNAKGQTVKL